MPDDRTPEEIARQRKWKADQDDAFARQYERHQAEDRAKVERWKAELKDVGPRDLLLEQTILLRLILEEVRSR